MNALARLALTLILSCLALASQAQTQTVSTAPPDFSRAELDQMLAPIALYPDTVLSHVLIAATYPLEVVQAARWATANSKLSAESAVAAVENENWDPSVKALVAFPQVLQRMSDDLDWTQRVGDAFLADEAEVMNVIQDLRQKAYAAGSLDKMEHVTVQREEKVIVIEPAVERVVYVPYYDTRVVYGNWWWSDYPPVYWHHPRHHVFVGGFYWGPRVYVAPSFFFSSFHWHHRRVVVIDYHHHHHPRFYSSRHIAHYHGARHWHHNPVHRRGVVYRNDNIRHHYNSNRQSYRALQEERNYSRRHTAEGHARPNSARPQHRPELTNNRNHDTPRPITHWRGQSDAERVRDRLANGPAQGSRDSANVERKYPQRTGPNTTKTGERDDFRNNQPERPTAVYRNNNTVQRSAGEVEQRRDVIQRTQQNAPRQTTWQGNQQRPSGVQQPDFRQPRQEIIRRTENVQQPQRSPRQAEPHVQRRIEQSRPQPQVHRGIGGGNQTRAGGGNSGVRESRRIER